VKRRDRKAAGLKIAGLVLAAEEAFPAPGSGPLKRQWVIKEARKGLDLGSKDPSAAFGRWFGAAMLKIAIEVAVAVMNQIKKAATDG
jgi:hypothetical protein